jgi:hypothetical protein
VLIRRKHRARASLLVERPEDLRHAAPGPEFGALPAIRPFRHLIVYPPMLREHARRWAALTGGATHATPG